ncbi:MAG: hypothetical protein H0T69_17295 [Thermoleophilaceae bacterium]|nr:hypothetical protein [Thermoleophilaceae bacterium]
MATRKVHQTTVRFEADLWEALESECAELGLSVAQYVREAALQSDPLRRAEGGQTHHRARELRDEILRVRPERRPPHSD